MGFAKEQRLKQQERSCGAVSGWVCAKCFDDYALREFVLANATSESCSFCEREAAEPIAAVADDVVGLIMDGIQTEWLDPVHESPYESAEDGYLWDGIDFDEVLAQVGDPIATYAFQQAVAAATADHTVSWCKRDYVAPYLDEAMAYDWEELADQVKHQSRYFFMLPPEGEPPRPEPGQARTTLEILERIASLADEAGLIRELASGESFWRARRHATGKRYVSAAELGTAKSDACLGSNRMSPAGIPAFYGASDLETALAEVGGTGHDARPAWSAAKFRTTEDCLILDLVDIGDPPSIFDSHHRHLRRPLMFLARFAEEVSKPLAEENREQIDYVPTQVVSEFLRLAFRSDGRPISGIRYASAQRDGGACIALFVPHRNCLDGGGGVGLSLRIDQRANGETGSFAEGAGAA